MGSTATIVYIERQNNKKYLNIIKNYYKDAHAVIFVFDVNIKKITEKKILVGWFKWKYG